MSYSGYITKLKTVEPHPNADRLKIAEVFGNSVVVGLNMQEGDLVLYFPTDGKLGEEFAVKNKLTRSLGGYLDDEKRHIRAIRLRGEKSDGLIMSLETLSPFCNISDLKEGDRITTLKGVLICEKYVPKRKNRPAPTNKKKEKAKVNTYPLFVEHYDTQQLAYNKNMFREGDLCTITLKLHGSSQRMSNTIEYKNNFVTNLLNKFGLRRHAYKNVTGTRRVVLDSFEGGYYGGNEFREKWHNFFESKLHKGESIYFEVVGYTTKKGQLIMPVCNNKKTGDKEFIKKYGETTKFTYGCEDGESDIYVYRMTMTNEDGHVVEYPTELAQLRCEQMGVKHAPVLDKFFYTTQEDLEERIALYEDGQDPIGKTHIREGICVRIENRDKFTCLKQKNFEFRLLEGIIKADDVIDIEEEESIK